MVQGASHLQVTHDAVSTVRVSSKTVLINTTIGAMGDQWCKLAAVSNTYRFHCDTETKQVLLPSFPRTITAQGLSEKIFKTSGIHCTKR